MRSKSYQRSIYTWSIGIWCENSKHHGDTVDWFSGEKVTALLGVNQFFFSKWWKIIIYLGFLKVQNEWFWWCWQNYHESFHNTLYANVVHSIWYLDCAISKDLKMIHWCSTPPYMCVTCLNWPILWSTYLTKLD